MCCSPVFFFILFSISIDVLGSALWFFIFSYKYLFLQFVYLSLNLHNAYFQGVKCGIYCANCPEWIMNMEVQFSLILFTSMLYFLHINFLSNNINLWRFLLNLYHDLCLFLCALYVAYHCFYFYCIVKIFFYQMSVVSWLSSMNVCLLFLLFGALH